MTPAWPDQLSLTLKHCDRLICHRIRHVMLVPVVPGGHWGQTVIWGHVHEMEMAAQNDNGSVVMVDLHIIIVLTCTIAISLQVV